MYAFSQGFSSDALDTRTLCVALNETQAAEYLRVGLELSAKRFSASSNVTAAEKEMRKMSGISLVTPQKVASAETFQYI